MNDRLRTETSSHLMSAAVVNGCKGYVQQSVLFLYGDKSGQWVDESTPIDENLPDMLRSARTMEHMASRAHAEQGLATVTLRFGMFYAHDAAATRDLLSAARAGKLPVIGDGANYWNPLNVDDAARAVRQAAERVGMLASEVFNVCDDVPVLSRDLVRFICERVGARPPRSVPSFLAKVALGSRTYRIMTASVRCDNTKAKQELGWQPSYRSSLDGYAEEIRKWLEEEGSAGA